MELFHGSHDRKAELIKRAVEHREEDHLIQEYGYFEPMEEHEALHYNQPHANGAKCDWKEGDFAGCAIGCLASPVLSQQEYRRLFKLGELHTLSFDDAREVLQDEFGIDFVLVTMAEHLFERLSKEEAQKWPEQFARALPVGAEVNFAVLSDGLFTARGSWWYSSDGIRMYDADDAVERARDQLLSFLTNLPTPAYGGAAA